MGQTQVSTKLCAVSLAVLTMYVSLVVAQERAESLDVPASLQVVPESCRNRDPMFSHGLRAARMNLRAQLERTRLLVEILARENLEGDPELEAARIKQVDQAREREEAPRRALADCIERVASEGDQNRWVAFDINRSTWTPSPPSLVLEVQDWDARYGVIMVERDSEWMFERVQ